VEPCPASVCFAEAHQCIHKAEDGPAVPLLASVRLFLASSGLTVILLSPIEAQGGSAASASDGGAPASVSHQAPQCLHEARGARAVPLGATAKLA
jgi:hypothetical protein